MHTHKIITLLFIVVMLNACKATYESNYYDDDEDIGPELYSFHIVDSYDINSEFEPTIPLRISPYLDHGFFELSWEVNSTYAYRAELIVNDAPTPNNGISVSSAWCGPGEECGRLSYQHCFYDEDLSLSCELPESTQPAGTRDISALFNAIPEQLYFILEVCDSELFYCEYQTKRVTLE